MRLKIAPNDNQSMSQDGDAILRSLQNKSLPITDLMVRESLQNSLDASLPDTNTTIVDFNIDEFSSSKLAPHFEGIVDVLLRKYPGAQTFLAISDKNTTGLTGDYQSDDAEILDESNFQKLVFGIGKNQDEDGSGGSWGLGKTSYFRMGIGLVIYYTRIRTEQGFEERLIASLIESPKKDERLLEESERGIAWWGEFDSTNEKIYPVTEISKISEILEIFNLKNYRGEETGTTVLIPYLKNIELDGRDNEIGAYPWEFDRKKSISIAVQRWYSPRIWNKKYSEILGNSQLECSVNGVSIHPMINMEPIFVVFQELYTSALLGESQKEKIKVKAIRLPRNAMKDHHEPLGHIAFCEVSREDINMIAPENKPSGLAYLGVKDKAKIEKNISKVVAYSRKPGMVVEYSIDGEWAPSGLIQNDDHLLLAFFVPNSYGVLLGKFEDMGYLNLEAYLRASENADHAKWEDEDGIGIIRRIKSYSANAIQEAFQDLSGDKHLTATSALSRKFGAMLMPPKNFGKTSARKKVHEKDKRKVESRNRISDISVVKSLPVNEQNVEVSFKAFIKRQSTSTVYIQVLTQDQKMDKDAWIKSMGAKMDFPFSIQKVFLEKVDDEVVNKFVVDFIDQEISFNLNPKKAECFEISSKIPTGIEVEGIIYLNVKSNQYLPNIAIRTEVSKEEGEK